MPKKMDLAAALNPRSKIFSSQICRITRMARESLINRKILTRNTLRARAKMRRAHVPYTETLDWEGLLQLVPSNVAELGL